MKEKRCNGLIPIYSITSSPSLAAHMGKVLEYSEETEKLQLCEIC